MNHFAHLLRAEWTKFVTVRGWVLGMLTAAIVTVLVGLVGSGGGGFSCAGPNGQACPDRTPPVGPDGTAVTDAFNFVHQPLTGNGSIAVKVSSLTDPQSGGSPQPWAKAGILVKDGVRQGSAYAAVMLTGAHGVRMQYDYTHDIAGTPSTDPRWLRLTRTGDTILAEESADGARWQSVGTAELRGLPSTVEVGMFATSPDAVAKSGGPGDPTTVSAGFEGVGLRGQWGGTWASDKIGDRGGAFERVGSAFVVSGAGDIAPVVVRRGSLAKTVESGLVGAFAGLIVVTVVAGLTVTGEYRRGLIRTTLTASPRRGLVLAAKSVVLGGTAFVTGLVAAAVAIPVVTAIQRGKGFPILPVSGATEAGVIVGIAALLAVTAILTSAVGVILRRAAGVVTAVVVAMVLPYLLAIASVLPEGVGEWLLRLTPAAAFAVQQSLPEYAQVAAAYTPANGYFPLPSWGGFAVLCGYTALAIGAAAVVLRRRDA
ncbi:ABC transporter permease subunit [Amycolatopsis taiwanensis]|uniref:ABC transporter permease subunit n=1 Tax=Amycolatopsis taiwanensis TaxID=342230 RepID=UPI000486D7BA|nr:ABC transporter permease subunit [Amycolatopsis taiwanensis]